MLLDVYIDMNNETERKREMKTRKSQIRTSFTTQQGRHIDNDDMDVPDYMYESVDDFINILYKDLEDTGATDILIELVIKCEKCGDYMQNGLVNTTTDTAICDECESK